MRIKRRKFTRYKKRYRRRTRRTTSISRYKRRSMQPEVKYFTFVTEEVPSNVTYTSTPSTTMYATNHLISNILGGITLGTSNNQRIGNKIYVKFVQFHIFTHGCPGTSAYSVDAYNLRVIVANTGQTRVVATNNVNTFFGAAVKNTFNGLIDRTRVVVKYDKVFRISPGAIPTSALVPDNFCGPSKRISITIPIGKVIEYNDGLTAPKNDADYLSLYMMTGTPGMNATTNATQIACSDITFRVYYTDV